MSDNLIDIEGTIRDHLEMANGLLALTPTIAEIARRMSRTVANGGKILWMGNGGSAADSQHLAAELMGRYTRERRAIPSIALTTDTSILTAIGNDYGYDVVFSRQVEALARPGDVVVGISTSGNSPNVLTAFAKARELGALTVGLTGGSGGQMVEAAEICLVVPATLTARIQEGHILIGHTLCDWVEASVMG